MKSCQNFGVRRRRAPVISGLWGEWWSVSLVDLGLEEGPGVEVVEEDEETREDVSAGVPELAVRGGRDIG